MLLSFRPWYKMRRTKTTDAPAGRTVLNRRAFLKKTGLASLGWALAITPWALPSRHVVRGDGTKIETIRETNTMELTRNTTSPQVTIPPIDAAAPAATETATFAMG